MPLPPPIPCTACAIVVITLLLIVVVWSYFKKVKKERKVFKKPFNDGIDWDVNAK